MRLWELGAVMLLVILVASCGGNSTAIGVTIAGPGASPMTVIVNSSVQFGATVTGGSTTTVYWQICKTPSTSPATIAPTDCTAGQGPTGCTIATVANPLTGFGTITANGRYTAPPAPPLTSPNANPPNSFLIVATSCIKSTAFGTFTVMIDSGIRVRINPTTASIATSENFLFTATVTGTTNTAVVWSVNNIPGGNDTVGIICPNSGAPQCTLGTPGQYFAPTAAPGAVTVTAQSGADPSQQASATVSVTAATPPTVATVDPEIAAQGSVQQDVYLTGTNFLSTSRVLAGATLLPTTSVTFLKSTLLRVTIPAAQFTQALPVKLSVQSQDTTLTSGTATLNVVPVRPGLVASSPDSVQRTNGGASLTVNLTGGFFVPGSTTATFNGIGCGGGAQVCTTFVDSRHLSVDISNTSLNTPGLYPIIVTNADAASASVPSISGLNLAVSPEAGSALLPGSPIVMPDISVRANPSAVAIDEAHGYAVVANTGDNSVSLVDLRTNALLIATPIGVGKQPTGVAVDDLLTDPTAVVVNSGDKTVTTIDLTTQTVVGSPLSVSIGPSASSPVPFAIGINSLTHRAIVAYQSSNQATILDLSSGAPVVVQQIGASPTPYSTGPNPQVAIDPRLNWALVTPGGAGTTNLVDLGRNGGAGDVGRAPQVVGSLNISTTTQGIGINTETHQALLTNPQAVTLTEFSLLDNSVTPVTFTNGGTPFTNYVAAAVNPLENVSVAVNGAASNATAVIVDLETGLVLQNVNKLGSTPRAVAVDPATNEAVVANQGDGTVSILSLGPAPSSPQIVEASPAVTFTSGTSLKLTLTGSFPTGSVVRLDQTQATTAPVAGTCTPAPVVCRQLNATVPSTMLGSARRFIVDVLNTGTNAVSNVTDLAVIQAVSVGNAPVGVAVDTDRDLAVVTNSFDDTVSLVSLAPSGVSPQSLGNVGVVGLPIAAGITPEGVAVLPRLGFAVVTNNGSGDASFIDYSAGVPTPTPATVSLCTGCGPAGVAIDPDTAEAVVADTNQANSNVTGGVSTFLLPAAQSAVASTFSVDPDPVAVAVDPNLNYAVVATASSASTIDFINLASVSVQPGPPIRSGVNNPSGVVFDPVNQVFLAANSLSNNVLIVDPTTFQQQTARVGIEPTSLDYDFQTSTLVTVNAGSRTMSVLDYACPPSNTAPGCPNPHVRVVLGLGGAQSSSLVLGPNAVAIDPRLNLAVLVDPDNNRVLLVPLPH